MFIGTVVVVLVMVVVVTMGTVVVVESAIVVDVEVSAGILLTLSILDELCIESIILETAEATLLSRELASELTEA